MHILSDKYPFFRNRNRVYFFIRLPRKAFLENSLSIVARIRKQGNQADMLGGYIGRELIPLHKPGLRGCLPL